MAEARSVDSGGALNRRGFLQAILASATAPYVVTTAGVLMPVRKILVQEFNEKALEDMIVEIAMRRDDRGIPLAIKPTEIIFLGPGGRLYANGKLMSHGWTINDALKRLV